jgi:sigma-54 specific flagellar transcriptional regulator A
MSESRILLIDGDAVRAERTVALLEFMDFNPRWVSDGADINPARHRAEEWMAVIIGSLQDAAQAAGFLDWLGTAKLPPPVLLMAGDPVALANTHGLHQANVWPLETPLRHAQLEAMLRRASLKRLDAEHHAGAQQQDNGPTGSSEAVTRLRQLIEQVATFDTTVLVLGESGTGKEVVARSIHQHSPRRDGPFVAINCGAIPADLLESELFGHEKGAFTGALSTRKGRFEMAEGGTLLLDEIGDMSLPMQVKLLRVLQERSFERVGGGQTIRCNVRVIAATHRNLETRIGAGQFREDLFYRLNVFPIEMPALRERLDDLPILVSTIAEQLARTGRGNVHFADEALQALRNYTWPGNVRELTNLVERLAVLHPGGLVRVQDLPAKYRGDFALTANVQSTSMAAPVPSRPILLVPTVLPPQIAEDRPDSDGTALPDDGLDLRGHMASIELRLINEALERTQGVVAHAAQLLGLRRTTLVEKLRKYGIDREQIELTN